MRLVCILLLLACSAAGQNRFQFADDLPCYVERQDGDLILQLANRISAAWTQGEPDQLASQLMPTGNVYVSAGENFKGRIELKEAAAKPLALEIFKGTRLEIVITCLRYLENRKLRQAQLQGIWRISRLHSQEGEAPGTPAPQQPLLAGGEFDGILVRDEGVWAVGSLRLVPRR